MGVPVDKGIGAVRPVSVLVAAYIGFLFMNAVLPKQPTSSEGDALLTLLLALSFFVLAGLTTALIIRESRTEWRPLRGRTVLFLLILAVPLRALAGVITGSDAPPVEGGQQYLLLPTILIGFFGSLVLAPIAEEWVFRGCLLPREPGWGQVTFNALLFALLHHWNFAHLGAAAWSHAAVLMLGIVLGATKKFTGNILACALAFINQLEAELAFGLGRAQLCGLGDFDDAHS